MRQEAEGNNTFRSQRRMTEKTIKSRGTQGEIRKGNITKGNTGKSNMSSWKVIQASLGNQ
jgi:hypothetical protein